MNRKLRFGWKEMSTFLSARMMGLLYIECVGRHGGMEENQRKNFTSIDVCFMYVIVQVTAVCESQQPAS